MNSYPLKGTSVGPFQFLTGVRNHSFFISGVISHPSYLFISATKKGVKNNSIYNWKGEKPCRISSPPVRLRRARPRGLWSGSWSSQWQLGGIEIHEDAEKNPHRVGVCKLVVYVYNIYIYIYICSNIITYTYCIYIIIL